MADLCLAHGTSAPALHWLFPGRDFSAALLELEISWRGGSLTATNGADGPLSVAVASGEAPTSLVVWSYSQEQADALPQGLLTRYDLFATDATGRRKIEAGMIRVEGPGGLLCATLSSAAAPDGAATAIEVLTALVLRLGGAADMASGRSPVEGSFSAPGVSAAFTPLAGRGFNVSLSGTFSGAVRLERSFDGTTFLPLTAAGVALYAWTAPASEIVEEPEAGVRYRLACTGFAFGTIAYRISQ